MTKWTKMGIYLFLSVLSTFQVQAFADYHPPPPRFDCVTSSGNSITFYQYATNTEKRKRYNGVVYRGSVGEQVADNYDEIVYTELPNNALNLKGKGEGNPFEMNLERRGEQYIGFIDFQNYDGTKEHWQFQRCAEYTFCDINLLKTGNCS
jgi:hypothetical protein